MIGRPDPQAMRQTLQWLPFLGEGGDHSELDIAWILEACEARQGFEEGRFTAAAIPCHQQRPGSRVKQVKQDRQAVFSPRPPGPEVTYRARRAWSRAIPAWLLLTLQNLVRGKKKS